MTPPQPPTETVRLIASLSVGFALYVRGKSTEPRLYVRVRRLIRHLVVEETPPEAALRVIKEAIPWRELVALPVEEVPGHDPERARDALIKWAISEYFRQRNDAKTRGRVSGEHDRQP